MTCRTRLVVPETMRVEVDWILFARITAKDVVLHLLADPALRSGQALGQGNEFVFPTV